MAKDFHIKHALVLSADNIPGLPFQMDSSGSLIQELELFKETLSQVYILNYYTTAVFVTLLYDTVLTLSKEIEFIWRKPFSFAKVLYVIARYYGLLSSGTVFFMTVLPDRSLNSCHSFLTWYSSVGPEINEIVVNLILLLRIYALYGQNKKLLCLIVPLYITESAFVIYGGIGAVLQDDKVLVPFPFHISLPGCFFYLRAQPSYRVTLAAWIPALIQAATFFGLSVYKVYEKTITIHEEFWSFKKGLKIPEVMKVIFLDGVIFYFANTAVIVLGVTLLLREHNPFSGFSALTEIIVYSICGCHFILHLYEIASRQQRTYITNTDVVFKTQGHVFAAATELELSDISDNNTLTPA